MKTKRLYYDDQYQHAFSAQVISAKPGWVELDQTVFYPEGGGQPADHGWLNDIPVTDVQVEDDGLIWHQVAEPIAVGTAVSGKIDWQRRFDLMQQHSGQHVLSQAFWQLFSAATVGFHLGEQAVTIDLDRPDFSPEELQQVEDLANAVIRGKRAVVAKFVAKEDLPLAELRKLPKVTEDIRLVTIDGFDICPCGGTHVHDLGDIGLLKLVGAEKRRGNLRVSFVAGRRAYADYLEKHQLLQTLSTLLSQPILEVGIGVERLVGRIAELEKQLKDAEARLQEQEAEQLWAVGETVGSALVICQEFSDRELDAVKNLAGVLVSRSGVVAACGLMGDPYRLVLAASPELGLHAGNLLKQVVLAQGGKGGGAPLSAQGAVPKLNGRAALQDLRQAALVGLSKETSLV